jgi:GNAT superfamily N-acetyltransferase
VRTGESTVQIRAIRADEFDLVSELCLRSKAVWGYDRDFLDACRGELTVRPDELERTSLRVADRNGSIVGVVQVSITEQTADLQKLFVEPSAIGTGIGRTLFEWATATAQRLGAVELTIDADPGAVGFYKSMGAREHGTAPSGSIPDRVLPHLRLKLQQREVKAAS